MLVSSTGKCPTTSRYSYTPFLVVGSIHQYSFPAEDLQVYPLQPGQALLAQRRSRSFHPSHISTVSEPRHLVEEVPTTSGEYRLASSTSSCSFPVDEVMFQFPITSLWRDCHLRVAPKSPRVELASQMCGENNVGSCCNIKKIFHPSKKRIKKNNKTMRLIRCFSNIL